MKRLRHRVQFAYFAALVLAGTVLLFGQASDPVAEFLSKNQTNLATEGLTFLLQEASRTSFFLVGGLHGDNETQALVQDLGQALGPFGYRYTATEMSPWAANRLLASLKSQDVAALWGSDIEEAQPHVVIRELAAANPQNESLRSMSEMTRAGYRRSLAPALLQLARQAGEVMDIVVQGMSLRALLLRTLEIEVERLDPASELAASVHRETFMKETFVDNYRRVAGGDVKPKVIVVFGRNHMHRGYDRRGVSTLGNFIAELAVAEGVQSFHLALFAAGGRISLGGLQDADQRKDDPAFELLASLARYPATIFDLRPLRQPLRDIPSAKRSPRDASLLYWSDSYDAIVCYREVTPVGVPRPNR
jgi:hypothetical protein